MAELDRLHSQIESLFEGELDTDALANLLKGAMPADIASILEHFEPTHQIEIFKALEDEEHEQEVLAYLEGESLTTILSAVGSDRVAHYLEEMPPDEAADVLEEQTEEVVKELLSKVEPETAAELQSLRLYKEGTAGSLMTPDFFHVSSHLKIKEIWNILKKDGDQIETVDQGFVLTEAGKIIGHFQIHDLLKAPEGDFILKYIEEDYLYVKDTDSQDVVLQMMARHTLSSIPVVDRSGVMKGIITADDMLEVAREIMDQDFYQMVGTSGDPNERSIWARVMHRAPWLGATLFGGSISALILRTYDIELQLFAILTIFIPFVIGMAGNVGIQSATIIVRDLVSAGSQRSLHKNVIREIFTGMTNAVLFGLATFGLLFLANISMGWSSHWIEFSVAMGLFLAMVFASLIGATIPTIFNRLKIDPAISSGPIITALIDIIGLTIYLFTSTLILQSMGIKEMGIPSF